IVRETNVWLTLQHENVLQLLGVAVCATTQRIWLVSPWIVRGSMKQYLKDDPEADCMVLSRGLVQGVAYLHSMGVVHEDIRATNVLVDSSGQPLLADFGLSRTMEQLPPPGDTTTSMTDGSLRWMAPERL
ncbi:kinase-like protein, partial [Calocera cornea HHB12733]